MRTGVNPNAELTAKQLAFVLGVSPQLVNHWHTDGYRTPDGQHVHLPEAGRNRQGHRLFRYLDGAKAEAATRQSPKSYRKPGRSVADWAALDRKPSTSLARVPS